MSTLDSIVEPLFLGVLGLGVLAVGPFGFTNWGLQPAGTWRAADLGWFHSYLNSVLFGILLFVFMLLVGLFLSEGYFSTPGLVYRRAEFLASWVPALILMGLMVPSLLNLYASSVFDTCADLTVKIVGHQWYWSVEYSDVQRLSFDIYMKGVEDLEAGETRLLEPDARVVLPCDVNVRICVTSGDVIHSLSLPRLGIKIDAVPGVLSVGVYKFPVVGLFYGQCSEICGANHTFIPICFEVTSFECFIYWASLVISD